MGSTVYSHGEGAVVAEVELLVYTHVGMELKWMRLIFSLYSNEREQTRSMMSIYSHGEGAEVGEVEHILPWEAIGVGEVDHILPWGRELKRMGSTIYSHGEGAVVAEVEFLVYTHEGRS